MRLIRGDRSQSIDTLIKIGIVLGTLLTAIAAYVLIGDLLDFLSRFRTEIFLFIIGAILAYLLAPLVRMIEHVVRKRWAAILSSYLLLFLLLGLFGFLLINPFISQARSLADNLQTPGAAKLQALVSVKQTAARIQSDLAGNKVAVRAYPDILTLKSGIAVLSASKPPPGQIRIPPSYVAPIARPANALSAAFTSQGLPPPSIKSQQALAAEVAAAAKSSYQKASSTPALLLGLQTWFDQHGITVDLQDKFGKALQQVSSQLANLVNNALSIALRAGNLLLNTVLMLIVSIYFLSDGARLVRWLVGLTPSPREAQYLVNRLDQILGTYLRTQVLMALLAATLDALGAVVLGVPYAIVIFFSSFLLSLVPVIGPVLLPFPPMIIAIVFAPLPTPILYLAWLLIGEQLATNVIGPRLQGHSVGIHPLEAMAAALAGFPLAGFLGSFFAVPTVAFLHVVVKETLQVRAEHGVRSDSEEQATGVPGSPAPNATKPDAHPLDSPG
jgi:predicted PurR-regulated permease PerM